MSPYQVTSTELSADTHSAAPYSQDLPGAQTPPPGTGPGVQAGRRVGSCRARMLHTCVQASLGPSAGRISLGAARGRGQGKGEQGLQSPRINYRHLV